MMHDTMSIHKVQLFHLNHTTCSQVLMHFPLLNNIPEPVVEVLCPSSRRIIGKAGLEATPTKQIIHTKLGG